MEQQEKLRFELPSWILMLRKIREEIAQEKEKRMNNSMQKEKKAHN